MPLPSVEAASREAAIAAAREQYGSSVRIVGIRRVRSGGVMGFFATERYVAEVEEIAPAPAVERRPASRAESAARIEAALRRNPVLPDPVDEVAGLLARDAGEPDVDLYSRAAGGHGAVAPAPAQARPAAAPTSAQPAARPAPARPVASSSPARPVGSAVDDAAPPPSPFTAALAQMVAGDVDVREAVDEAIAAVTAATAVAAPAAPAAATPPAPVPPAPVAEPVPVVDAVPAVDPTPLVDAGPLVPAVEAVGTPAPAPEAPVGPASVPEWVADTDFTTGPITSREEAIAEVLRAALAHDTSDAALTQLLRGVLAGSSVEDDLPEPAEGYAAVAPAHDTCAAGGHTAMDDRTAMSDDEYAFAEAHTAELPVWVDAAAEADQWEVVGEVLAPTASDPAPLQLDATTVLPPLSLLPPPAPGTALAVPPLLSRPPVPPATRRPAERGPRATGGGSAGGLATVTRLPVAQRSAAWRRSAPVLVTSVRERPRTGTPATPGAGAAEEAIVRRLLALGVPRRLLDDEFAAEVARSGTYAALTRALAAGLPPAPALPGGPGEVLLAVGPGVETLAAARSLAASLRLDGERLQWASRGDLAALAPRSSRIAGIDTALERKQEADRSGTLTIVAVDAPMRAGGGTWLEQMIAVFAPAAVWAVVEATRKPEDLGPWLDGLPRVDALMVQDTDLTADPAAVLARTATPVALLDGVRATAHRWASLLCERLESSGT